MLVMAGARSRSNSNRLQVRRPPEAILRVLRLAGVEAHLPLQD